MVQPRIPHWHAALHVVKYLKGTQDWGYFIPHKERANSQLTVMLTGEHALLVQGLSQVGVCSWQIV